LLNADADRADLELRPIKPLLKTARVPHAQYLETPNQPFLWLQGKNSNQEPSTTLRMRHRIYDHPGCVPEIAKWVNERFDGHPI
jgi:hypothetical protein